MGLYAMKVAALLLLSSLASANPDCGAPSPCASLANVAASIGLSDDITYNTSTIEPGTLNFTGIPSTNNVTFCRVMGSMPYGAEKNNTLLFELWLPPRARYNQRYLSVGRFTVCYLLKQVPALT